MVLSVRRTKVPRESCCATVARQNLGEETVLMIQLTLATLFFETFKTFSQNPLCGIGPRIAELPDAPPPLT